MLVPSEQEDRVGGSIPEIYGKLKDAFPMLVPSFLDDNKTVRDSSLDSMPDEAKAASNAREAARRRDKIEALKNTPSALQADLATGINAGNSPEGLEEMVDAGDAGGVKVNPRAASRMAQGLALAQLGAGIASGDLGKGISDASTMFAAQTDRELDNAREDRNQKMLEKYYGRKNINALSFEDAYDIVLNQNLDFITGELKDGVTSADLVMQANSLMQSQSSNKAQGYNQQKPASERYSITTP